ncbi:MAG: S8 family serine peptidase, partial [Acidobacteria bacterium]|nr:S8 family serine peptidase [Acidobacteriota bacterium]
MTLATTSTEQDEAAVVAKITDLDKWEQLSEVQIGAAFGSKDPDGTLIVTGRIPVMRIEYVRQQPFVSSLKGAQLLQPTLNKTLKETGAHEDLLPKGNQVEGGKGVVVGIIDYGMDFVHQNFRNSGGSTRLLSIWDQAGPATAASPLGYGREYSRDEINHALGQNDPYAALGYGPAKDTRGTHGTHVADIAAGNGRGSSVPGVAPNADLVFVEVSHADISFSGPEVVGSSFGDSVRLLEAVQYIFHKAKERPCVINVSLGTNGGPHDGSTLVEDAIDRLIRQAPNRAVVIAASNSFSDGIHAAGKVRENGHSDLKWEVLTGDASYNELEVWYSGRDKFAVELIAPGGNSLGTINPGTNGTLVIENQVLIFVANRLDDPNNGDNMIGVFLERGLPAGQWIVRLHGLTSRDGSFHAWIERDNLTPSNFAPPHDNTHTLGSISCGHETIVVGSYDGNVYAIRAADGQELWRFAVKPHAGVSYGLIASSAAIARVDGQDRVYVGGGETMYALDAASGALLWEFDAGTGCTTCGLRSERNEILSSPAVLPDQDLVLFGMDVNDNVPGKGGFFALSAQDGLMRWYFDLE